MWLKWRFFLSVSEVFNLCLVKLSTEKWEQEEKIQFVHKGSFSVRESNLDFKNLKTAQFKPKKHAGYSLNGFGHGWQQRAKFARNEDVGPGSIDLLTKWCIFTSWSKSPYGAVTIWSNIPVGTVGRCIQVGSREHLDHQAAWNIWSIWLLGHFVAQSIS